MRRFILLVFFISSAACLNAQGIRQVKLAELQALIDTCSQPLVLNFWATWCGPCVHEIPWFEKSVARFTDKNIRLVLVSLDVPAAYPGVVASFVKKNKYRSEVLWLDEAYAEEFCPRIDPSWQGTIPVTLMVNHANGYRRFYNQQLPEARLVQELEKLVH